MKTEGMNKANKKFKNLRKQIDFYLMLLGLNFYLF